jgi:hypothetical protein
MPASEAVVLWCIVLINLVFSVIYIMLQGFLPKRSRNNQNKVVRKALVGPKAYSQNDPIAHTVLIALNVRARLSMQGDRMKPPWLMPAEQQQLFQRQSQNIIWVVHYSNVHNAAIGLILYDKKCWQEQSIPCMHLTPV